jgi:hypothetical protein
LINTPSGVISYRWSTNERTDRIVVSPTVTTTYWVDVICARGGDSIVSRKNFKVDVHDCGVDGCASDIWVNIDQYPDCGSNGEMSVSSVNSEESPLSSFTVNWYDSNFNLIGSDYTLRNVPAGDYYVELNRDQCSAQRKVKLTAVDSRELSGLTMTVYEPQSGDGNDSPCLLDRKAGSSQVSTLSTDLSTMAVDYVVWTGFITPLCDGFYTFLSNVDGGNLLVNNEKILSGNRTVSDSVYMRAGSSYMFAYVKKRSSDEELVSVNWITPCSSREAEPIPSCALTPDPLIGLANLLKSKTDMGALRNMLDSCEDIPSCPEPAVNVEPFRQICSEGSSVTLSAFAPGASYQWRADGNQNVISNQSSISVKKAGFYTVDITSWCGTKIEKTVSVSVLGANDVTATASTTSACSGSVVTLYATGGTSYKWSPASGLSDASSASPTVTVDQSGSYTVRIQTEGGCVISKSVDVTVEKPFDFKVTQEYVECNSSVVKMTAEGADEYYWYPSDGLSCNRCPVTNVSVSSKKKEYTVEGVKDGCVQTKTVTVSPLLKRSDLDFTYEYSTSCSMIFTASDMGSNVSYHWHVESSPSIDEDGRVAQFHFPSDGGYRITLTAKRKDCDENSAISVEKIVRVHDCDPCNPCEVE